MGVGCGEQRGEQRGEPPEEKNPCFLGSGSGCSCQGWRQAIVRQPANSICLSVESSGCFLPALSHAYSRPQSPPVATVNATLTLADLSLVLSFFPN